MRNNEIKSWLRRQIIDIIECPGSQADVFKFDLMNTN